MNITLIKNKKFITVYPILIGILFFTNELRYNINDYNTIQVISLISIILSFCSITLLLVRGFIKNPDKASIISASFIIINIFYFDIVNALINSNVYNSWFVDTISSHIHRFTIPLLSLLFLVFSILIIKSKRKFNFLNLYLFITISAFIFVEIVKWTIAPTAGLGIKTIIKLSDNQILKNSSKPDIYYIILDSYTSNISLKQYWNFDNSAFVDSLKKEGFYFAQNSKSDYTSTPYCLASTLNCALLNSAAVKVNDLFSFNGMIYDNLVTQFLTNHGYSIINYSLFNIKNSNRYYNADFFWSKNYLRRTVWVVIIRFLKNIFYPNGTTAITLSNPKSYSDYLINNNLSIFRLLENVNEDEKNVKRPYFVYAHIMMPHEPYCFDENGNKLSLSEKKLPLNVKYLKQLVYTNSLVVNSVKQILSKSKNKPIIIIQGDHGFRALKNVISREKEAHTIINIYYLPNGGEKMLTDSIRPVNTFRVIFNYYFGQKLPLL